MVTNSSQTSGSGGGVAMFFKINGATAPPKLIDAYFEMTGITGETHPAIVQRK